MSKSPLFLLFAPALFFACKSDPKPTAAAQTPTPRPDTIEMPAPSNAPPAQYTLTQGTVFWSGRKAVGDAHEGTLQIEKGTIVLRGETLESGAFTLDMQSIAVTDITDAGERRDLESHLKDADFFEADKYTKAEFVFKEALPSNLPEYNWLALGNLSMKGKTQPVKVPVKISFKGEKLRVETPTFPIQRTLWGVNFRSGILGTAKDKLIDDNILLHLTLEAKKD